MKKIFFTILTLILLILPVLVFAQAGGSGIDRDNPLGFGAGGIGGGGLFGALFGCGPGLGGVGILGLLFGGSGVLCILQSVLLFLLAIAFVIAVIFLVVGGFRYIMAQGNDEAVENAKKTITRAIIGVVIIASAWILLRIVLDLFEFGQP